MDMTPPTSGVRPAPGTGGPVGTAGANPSTHLNELVMDLAHALGENPREVSLRLNRMMGVESRVNQTEEVLRGGVALARDWLDRIASGDRQP